MKDLIQKFNKNVLNESSLSRLHQHISEHECAVISAWRDDTSDMSKCDDSAVPGDENRTRGRDLKATLLQKGYGVTAIDGSYIENFGEEDVSKHVEVKEDSLFVANMKNTPDFAKTIESLGKRFCQDSVLIIPQGGKDAYLIGTNDDQFVGLGNTMNIGDFHAGEEAQIMSKIRGRPIVFREGAAPDGTVLETLQDHNGWFKRLAIHTIAKKTLSGE
jgi:hypothetical protein